ncbi:MAG TPA: hypothetical protein VGC41_27415 [Kofleriaceae bacterium]
MTDTTLVSLIDAVLVGGGEIAVVRLHAQLSQLDADTARSLYLRLVDAADPIAIRFARLPNREQFRTLLRGETVAPKNRVYARRAVA